VGKAGRRKNRNRKDKKKGLGEITAGGRVFSEGERQVGG